MNSSDRTVFKMTSSQLKAREREREKIKIHETISQGGEKWYHTFLELYHVGCHNATTTRQIEGKIVMRKIEKKEKEDRK